MNSHLCQYLEWYFCCHIVLLCTCHRYVIWSADTCACTTEGGRGGRSAALTLWRFVLRSSGTLEHNVFLTFGMIMDAVFEVHARPFTSRLDPVQPDPSRQGRNQMRHCELNVRKTIWSGHRSCTVVCKQQPAMRRLNCVLSLIYLINQVNFQEVSMSFMYSVYIAGFVKTTRRPW